MAVSEDLSPDALAAVLGERPVRAYPAVMSTDADAVAWARAGGPAGAVVVADYQAAARGRGGVPWECRRGRDLCFSVLLRPPLAPDDEGWLFVAAALAVTEVLGGDATVDWPDRVERGGRHVADVAAHAGLGPIGVDWAIVSFRILDAPSPRAPLVAELAGALERLQEPRRDVLARYSERCTTLGRDVVAFLLPRWPDGVEIAGIARSFKRDGAVVLEQPDGRRMAVRPQHVAWLDPAGA